MNVAVLTVFYDGMQQFMHEYMQCLQNQTYKNFTLVIVNDGLEADLYQLVNEYDITTIIIDESSTPQQNRLNGMLRCLQNGFDIIICSDSDETMYLDRIEHNVNYFNNHPHRDLVFNNSVNDSNGKKFDLFLKDSVCFDDILDFNVLGYGAMCLKTTLVPFIVSIANEAVQVFDWWIGSIYLLYNSDVDILENAMNNYRSHDNNIIGPVHEVNEVNITIGLGVKRIMYREMMIYCGNNGFHAQKEIYNVKLNEINSIDEYISKHSIAKYIELVVSHFKQRKSLKMFWWENIVSLNKLGLE